METEISQRERQAVPRRKKALASETHDDGVAAVLFKLTGLVPYRVGVWILRQLSRSRLLQRTLFRRAVRRLERFLVLLGQPVDHNRAVRRHLMGVAYKKSIRKWRLAVVEHGHAQQMPDLFPVTGWENLARACASGRGLILVNSHFGAGRFVPLVVAQKGIELLSLEGTDVLKNKLPENLKVFRLRDSFPARALYEGQKALKQGRVVHLAADGFAGGGGFVLTFLGRQRRFAAGFAELAVNADSVVIPVFAPFDEEGRLNFEFLDPLDSGSSSIPHSERIRSLVKQYARLLEQRWSQDPANVLRWQAEKFRRLPMDEAEGSGANTQRATPAP